ncbi:MAG: hypothetical protein O2782_08610 [bacterium]|nr:hypothetical protein [bacterium]
MTQVLDISEAVITERVLQALHSGQAQIRVAPGAVITPSGWDFLRSNRVRLAGGTGAASPAQQSATPATAAGIHEVLPPGTDTGVLSRGRCDHPDKPFGCRTEEFGSGFVEPSCCSACAVQQAGTKNCGCGGCNRAVATDEATEALVQTLTNEIMRRLENR